MKCFVEHIAAGGNRHSSAADWGLDLLIFGAGNNVALWNPDSPRKSGISALLAGHTEAVTALRIYDGPAGRLLISGSADKTIRIWGPTDGISGFTETQCLAEHSNAVNALAVSPSLGMFVSGAADGTVKIWEFQNEAAKLVQTISLKPRFLPLALAVTSLSSGDVVIAAAGTCNIIQLFVRPVDADEFELQASLGGHEGWIRSLDFTRESDVDPSDVLLASASQDKYIRLWRFHRSQIPLQAESELATNFTPVTDTKSLSNKAHRVGGLQTKYNVTFEALLVGHEDWIYTVRWRQTHEQTTPTLLSASADNSLAMWQADHASGLWVCNSRLGEISAQKGSTTATGSAGGFWVGLWSPNGHYVVSLGRTGSWRRWEYDSSRDIWQQVIGTSGHVQEVLGLAWSPQGDYLLTTSSDQTTRLLAEWVRPDEMSWHEFSRPQIHGYDLNCIDTVTDDRFISGADEKLLRVFDIPKSVNSLLSTLARKESTNAEDLPEVANIPVLGLSNKTIAAEGVSSNGDEVANDQSDESGALSPLKHALDQQTPPLEDLLSRHTLWPEHEKLYGHGYEISAVATSNDASLVATACKASSIDHAVIRIYETQEWREVKPALRAHSLTVTRLAFSHDDGYLLSVGRDRQWSLFKRDETSSKTYTLYEVNPKGHARMILDCAWAPYLAKYVFATAGRDKAVKVWHLNNGTSSCVTTVSTPMPVTALAWSPARHLGLVSIAYGTDSGNIAVVALDEDTLELRDQQQMEKSIAPARAVNALKWRPSVPAHAKPISGHVEQLAAGSDDFSVRIYSFC